MKRTLLLLIFGIGMGMMGWGQTPYLMSGGDYSETFTNIANTTTNWPDGFNGTDCAEWTPVAINATGTLGDGVKITVSTATFKTGTTGGVQRGSANIYLLSTSTTNSCAIDLLLNFTGRNAGTISFDVATVFNSTGNRDSKLKLFYSTDGTTFTEITGTNLPYTARNNVAGSASITTISLPSAFNNSSTARLRFYEYSTALGGTTPTGSQPKISIDNIAVTSTPAGTNPPSVTTQAVTGIGLIAATGNGTITSTGGVNPDTRGFCWGLATGPDPDLSANFSHSEEFGTFGTGAFPGEITGLLAGKEYKVRAYATNTEVKAAGTGYGNVVTFFTLSNEPSNHPTVFTATTNSQTQIDLAFSAASTIDNCAGYLILQNTASLPTGLPSDGTGYSVGNSIPTGTVAAIVNSTSATSASITGLSSGTQYYFKLFPYNWDGFNASTYNYKTNGDVPAANATTFAPNDETSEVDGPIVTSQPNPLLISSLSDTDGEAVRVFDMDIWDLGTDGYETKITQLTIRSGDSDDADWTQTIQGLKLSIDEGVNFITLGTVTINAEDIVIAVPSGNLNVPDEDAITVSLYIYLKTTVTDNKTLQFSVSQTSHGFTADATGSGFAAEFTNGTGSNTMMVDVDASKLAFVQQPSNTIIDATMSPAVTVQATDANGNRDLDKTGSVSLISSGTMTGPVTATLTGGFGTFGNIVHTAQGNNLTLTASLTGLTDAVSSIFNVIIIPKIFFSEYIEGSSNNKAVEIYNGESTAIDLTKLSVRLYANGASTPGNTWTGTSGTLDPGKIIIIYNSSASLSDITTYGFASSTVTFYNGDDALDIYYDGQTTDVFGTIGSDPGTAWNVAGTSNATLDKTLVRKLSVTQGTTDWASSAGTTAENSQWVVKAIDYTGNLGGFSTAWLGTTSTEFTTATNWDMGQPSSTTNIIITNVTNDPIIATSVEAKDMLIKSGGVLTVSNPGALTVSGTLTNNVVGNGGIVIKSDATGTGSLICDQSVNATVERYLTQNYYHYISSPVAAQAISPEFINTGETVASQSEIDLFKWDETTNTWDNIKEDLDPSTWDPAFGANFTIARGYVYANRTGNVTKNFAGAINVANQTINLTVTPDQSNGWNIVGNPFASQVAANGNAQATDNLIAVNASASIFAEGGYEALYFWDETIPDYVPVNNITDAYFVNPGQAFMIKAKTHNSAFAFNANNRKHGTSPFYKSTNSDDYNRFTLAVTGPQGDYNETLLGFAPGVTTGLDDGYDAIKRKGNANIALYSKLVNGGEGDFAIQALPQSSANEVVAISLDANKTGTYMFKAGNTDNMEYFTVKLEDRLTNTFTTLEGAAQYSFAVLTAGKIENRFYLHFKSSVGIEDPAATQKSIYSSGHNIYFETEGQATIEIFNLTGQKVGSREINTGGLQTINLQAPTGWYIVKLVSGNEVKSRKVFIN